MIFHYAGKYNGDESSLPYKEHHPNATPFKEPEDTKKLSLIANGGCILIMGILAIPFLILGIIPYILFLIFPQFVGLGLFGIICIGMGFGDYLNIYNAIKQMPKNSKTYLCGMHSYWYL